MIPLAVPQNLCGLPCLTTKIVAPLSEAALSEAAWITGQGYSSFSPRLVFQSSDRSFHVCSSSFVKSSSFLLFSDPNGQRHERLLVSPSSPVRRPIRLQSAECFPSVTRVFGFDDYWSSFFFFGHETFAHGAM